jgi:hypothetical protein
MDSTQNYGSMGEQVDVENMEKPTIFSRKLGLHWPFLHVLG